MRRSSRRSFLSLLPFFTGLLLILYLNRPRSKKTYTWDRVRYVPEATTVYPDAHGVCPGLNRATKPALVVSRVAADGDAAWLKKLKDGYHLCVYTVDEPHSNSHRTLQVPANRGHEAMAYLTFIIDNYDHLPAAGAVFIHGSRFAWHNDQPEYDNLALLSQLNMTRALAANGYANLKCDWSASTCSSRESPPQGSLETSMRAATEPWNDRVVSDSLLPEALATLFSEPGASRSRQHRLSRHDAVRSQCCAQFAVSREAIRQHSRLEYRALRQWLLDGTDARGVDARRGRVAPRDDRVAGRIISYLWHILFLVDAKADGALVDLDQLNRLACPDAGECYCRLYGRCGLQGCTAAGCGKQYSVPPGFTLPGDWAATHS